MNNAERYRELIEKAKAAGWVPNPNFSYRGIIYADHVVTESVVYPLLDADFLYALFGDEPVERPGGSIPKYNYIAHLSLNAWHEGLNLTDYIYQEATPC